MYNSPVRVILIVIVALVLGLLVIRYERGPNVATRIVPAGSVHADTTVRFAWHSVRGAVRYRIDVARIDVGRPDGVPIASAATLGDTTIDVSTLALMRGVDYRWTITAIDGQGRVSRSEPIAFTVTR